MKIIKRRIKFGYSSLPFISSVSDWYEGRFILFNLTKLALKKFISANPYHYWWDVAFRQVRVIEY